MLVTSLEKISKTRTRVTFDDDETLVLSDKELAIYDIHQGREMEESLYQDLLREMQASAMRYAGRLLKSIDYTTKGLRDKLLRAGYPEAVAETTLNRLTDAGYVDDRRYAETYVRVHLTDKSLTRIRMDLRQKGISKDLLEDVLRGYEDDQGGDVAEQERAQIRKFLTRKHYDPETMTFEDTARIKNALLRKGFSMDRIRQEMESIN